MAKRSMKIRGKGHLATKTNGFNRLNEVQKNSPREAKSEGRHFCFIKIFCLPFFLGLAFCWICHKVTSLYDRFMETLTSQCFGECEIHFFCAMQCTIKTKSANEDSGQKSAKNVNSLLETSFYYTFQYWVLGTLKKYFSGILHSFFKISLFFLSKN